MRGSFFVGLYRMRNFLFGIKATSTRRMIKARYDENLAALRAILSRSSDLRIDVLLYIVPLRNDVESPYDKSEYERFKQDVRVLADANHVVLANFEGAVPAKFWGSKASTGLNDDVELDFMHFQGRGHELLAAALREVISEHMPGSGR
jgi:lysophospholipase L1-like esterase